MTLHHGLRVLWAGLCAGCLCACGLGANKPESMADAPVGVWTIEPKDAVQRARAAARLDLAQAYFEQGLSLIHI